VDVADRVARGAKLLDKRGPPKWAARIDVEQLNLASPCACVLGQLYGTYYAGVQVMGEWVSSPTAAGFNVSALAEGGHFREPEERAVEFDALRVAWTAAIRERQAQ
jgi:hypothetical protein